MLRWWSCQRTGFEGGSRIGATELAAKAKNSSFRASEKSIFSRRQCEAMPFSRALRIVKQAPARWCFFQRFFEEFINKRGTADIISNDSIGKMCCVLGAKSRVSLKLSGMFRIVIYERILVGDRKYYVKGNPITFGRCWVTDGEIDTYVQKRFRHLHSLGPCNRRRVRWLHRRSISLLKFEGKR